MPITTKLEIDLLKSENVENSVSFVLSNKIPAIVAPSELMPALNICRGVVTGKFKLITMIDWTKGNHFNIEKFSGTDVGAMTSDGFEIVMTADPDKSKIAQEVKYLTNFVKEFFNPFTELRLVLGYYMDGRTQNIIDYMLDAIKDSSNKPVMIRTTPLTKIPSVNSDIDEYIKIVDHIRSRVRVPIKISGNVNSKIVAGCHPDFYGVDINQAMNIVKDIKDLKSVDKAVS